MFPHRRLSSLRGREQAQGSLDIGGCRRPRRHRDIVKRAGAGHGRSDAVLVNLSNAMSWLNSHRRSGNIQVAFAVKGRASRSGQHPWQSPGRRRLDLRPAVAGDRRHDSLFIHLTHTRRYRCRICTGYPGHQWQPRQALKGRHRRWAAIAGEARRAVAGDGGDDPLSTLRMRLLLASAMYMLPSASGDVHGIVHTRRGGRPAVARVAFQGWRHFSDRCRPLC